MRRQTNPPAMPLKKQTVACAPLLKGSWSNSTSSRMTKQDRSAEHRGKRINFNTRLNKFTHLLFARDLLGLMSAWVISRHLRCKKSCPLYPQERTYIRSPAAPTFCHLALAALRAIALRSLGSNLRVEATLSGRRFDFLAGLIGRALARHQSRPQALGLLAILDD